MRLVVVLAVACACSKPSAPEGTGSAGSAGSGSAAPDAAIVDAPPPPDAGKFDFNALDHDAQVDFMKTKVVPAMRRAFQEFDPKKYANFSCKTCHGRHAQQNKFKMPTPDLPRLDMKAINAGKQGTKMTQFMKDVVKPQMAKILQLPEYSDAEPTGFGCLDCHTLKK